MIASPNALLSIRHAMRRADLASRSGETPSMRILLLVLEAHDQGRKVLRV